jgi:hypothetical protein
MRYFRCISDYIGCKTAIRQPKGYSRCVAKPDRRTVLLAFGLVFAIALTFVFGYRAGRHVRLIRWENEPIRGWMSVPFIAHAHHVPPELLYQAIGLQPQPKDHRPLRRLAREQKRPVEQIIHDLDAAVAQYRAHPNTPEPKKP